MYSVFSSINANAFMNHLVLYVMPGESDVEPPMSVAEAMKRRPPSVVEAERTREEPLKGFGMTLAEARTVVSHVALSGVVYSLDSVLSELPEERVNLLKMTLPTMPIFPIDLFSRGTDMPMWDIFKHTTPDDYIHNYPEILDLKVNAPAGVYDVAAVTNWRSRTTTRPLAFADKLGLSSQSSYVVFDFWSQKLLGVFKGKMDVLGRATRHAGASHPPCVDQAATRGHFAPYLRRVFHQGRSVGRRQESAPRHIRDCGGR